MTRSRRMLALAALAGGLFAALGSPGAQAQDVPDIRLAGSSTIAPVMLEIGKLYEAGEGKARIFVETGGSSKGIADLRKGLTDVAMVSRELKPSEADLTAHVIARDGIAALIHAENPVQEISREELRAIFTGELSNWSQAGGPDREIIVVSKGEGSATSVVLNKFLGVTADQIKGDLVAAENAQMIKTVSLTPDSIGYVSIGAAMIDISFGVPVKLIALGEVPATLENVADGSYKATRPLNLVTTGAEAAELKALVGFSKSEAVSGIIRDLSYTPVSQ
ncbi:phosphate ABC transporter substrate-binding protein [Cribrihabitans pelagius]|uniref:phosphate ABC transporter substrate-binding protein n=1 Tax=Cribrihabitans pelagius TaxID=1765746 RepID=UPI003B5C3934